MTIRIYLEIRNRGVGAQLLDGWVAYRQSLNKNYDSGVVLVKDRKDADVKILFDYMFSATHPKDKLDYDILLACNGGEPIAIGSPHLRGLLESSDFCRLICNTRHNNKSIDNQLLWWPSDIVNCHQYWTRPFYPQHHEHQRLSAHIRQSTLILVNGRTTTWRHFVIQCIQSRCPQIPLHNQIDLTVTKTLDSQWESEEDQQFRELCNNLFPSSPSWHRSPTNQYYQNSVSIGLDSKFGYIPPGYFILPLYYENSCVIFPETTWQNDDLCITEKGLKCFFAGCLPFPLGGRGIHQMYAASGFATAWTLLPERLQTFDDIENHAERYRQIAVSIEWLQSNPHVWQSDAYRDIVDKNRRNLLYLDSLRDAYKQFDEYFQLCYQKIKERYA